jgi:hypothetical protein
MKKMIAWSLFTALMLAGLPALAGELDGRWLHVRVEDRDEDGEQVSINIPLALVESLLPTIGVEELDEGRIQLDEVDLEGVDLRAMLEGLRDAPDAEFVTVRSRDESVRVAKESGMLVVLVDEHDGERVRVQMPMQVVEAALAGDRDEIDLLAALNALADYPGGDLVLVESDEESVRVWIDSSDTGD